MKPERKNLTEKKPPNPSTDHEIIIEWIKHSMPDLQPVLLKIDRLIIDNIPKLQFAIKWGKAFYGTSELGWIIEIDAYAISINIVFLAGSEFNPTPPLGDNGKSRYIKIKSLDDTVSEELINWVKQAKLYDGWK